MARQLGRHRSTIYREIKRNTFCDRELPDYDGYYSTVAHDISVSANFYAPFALECPRCCQATRYVKLAVFD
jgi:hypothetical protein